MNKVRQDVWRGVVSVAMSHFWFKQAGITAFISVFFCGYLYLLKNPAFPPTIIPATELDRIIGFQPLALPFYLSLWVYVVLAPILMPQRRELVQYVAWMGSLCLAGLAIFYFWPSAIAPAAIDWAQYPAVAFLKNVDASGNACPSLHVATAMFSAYLLHGRLRALGLGSGWRMLSAAWCAAIVYSTMATKQHMALDVAGGAALAGAFALAYQMWASGWLRRAGKAAVPEVR